MKKPAETDQLGERKPILSVSARCGSVPRSAVGVSVTEEGYAAVYHERVEESCNLQLVEENIYKFAKKGLTPSQIGVILRDSHGIAQVKSVIASKILRLLKAHGLALEIPEDLYHLIKKSVSIHKHLERNKKDKDSKFRLILVESKIHRLVQYYNKTEKLPCMEI
ncbi:40S ribosomal protein S13-like [Juglans regia]|uniref:40S ribosomal protein S13-like n=1 Tax=Juglans regia TaxID=51240 RepID=A0A6P9EP39_JUGRE|nr:40S ribosomal protein S13-like [Juglans regia]